ncbi:MAG: hypothetical protein JWP29_4249 [Rhodoferax sp.]|nr:hypothetical protein [Rhodoferax sp.]
MNNKNLRQTRITKFMAACALAGAATCSFAADTVWDLGATCASGDAAGAIACGSITAQAYSTNTTAGTAFTTATIHNWGSGSGLGVYGTSDSGSPNHATDNSNGTDLIALNFGTSKVNLSTITLGWWANDADITVLAYTGSGVPNIAAGITTFTAANGWTSVKNYGAATTTATNTGGTDTDKSYATTDSTTYSSWWLISAYNASFITGSTSLDSISDYVKVLSVAGTVKSVTPPGKVPEPGSLALMGAAFCAFLGVRRRKAKAASI